MRSSIAARAAHQRRVERTGDRESNRADPPLLGERLGSLDRATEPEIATCAGEFSFATTNRRLRTSSQSDEASPEPTPSSAVIAPGRSSPARCIAAPRIALPEVEGVGQGERRRRYERRELTEGVTGHAEQGDAFGFEDVERRDVQASSAGCTNAVVARASSSWQPATTSRPIASDASCRIELPADGSPRSAIPGYWEPCPGNKIATAGRRTTAGEPISASLGRSRPPAVCVVMASGVRSCRDRSTRENACRGSTPPRRLSAGSRTEGGTMASTVESCVAEPPAR